MRYRCDKCLHNLLTYAQRYDDHDDYFDHPYVMFNDR